MGGSGDRNAVGVEQPGDRHDGTDTTRTEPCAAQNGTEPIGASGGPPVEDGLRDAIVATVFVDGVEVLYSRLGSGPVALVLVSDPDLRVRIAHAVTARCRTILTSGPGGRRASFQPSAGWIARFLDGLGIEHACILMDPEWADAVTGLASTEPDRVDHIVPLPGPTPDDARAHH